jgi:hypothetical protein
MAPKANSNQKNRRRSPGNSTRSDTNTCVEEYRVGPGRPPKEYQFKPGQSGNPKGAKRKSRPIALDLKMALERALNTRVQVKQGDREQTTTMAEAGMKQLVAQFGSGDRHARSDVFALADRLGVDLTAGQTKAIEEVLASNNQPILDAYVDRQCGKVVQREPVLAPPELLDDAIGPLLDSGECHDPEVRYQAKFCRSRESRRVRPRQ